MQSFRNVCIESIFNCIISSPAKFSGNFGPLVPVDLVELDDFNVLLLRPVLLGDVGVEALVPVLTALLRDASGQVLGDKDPVACANLFDEIGQNSLFLLRPSAFL